MAGPITTYPVLVEERRAVGDPMPWPTLLMLGSLWLLTINQLRVEWSINPQYTYGWTVPFLALYLFAERWKDRPPTSPIHFGRWLAVLVAIVGVALFPLRAIQEAAPDWRLVSWAMAGAATFISLCAVYRAGGWSWLRHFAIPVLFILIAVPWPMPLEKMLVQGLMRSVATLCVELLSFFAIPAIQHGNIIEVATGKVGVEEACSGVRSLQTTLMASLFLGELFRFTILRRLLLLAGGLFLAFACNLARSFYLVWISVHEGNAAVTKVHDTVGVIVLLTSLAGLAALCALLRPRGPDEPEPEPGARDGAAWRPRFAPRSVIVAAACWLLLIEAGTEWWYRSHETGHAFAPWSVQWPEKMQGFRDISLGETVRSILRYDEGRSATWQSGGIQWSMIFMRWMPGRSSSALARSHGPELCLASAGAVLHMDLGVKNMRVAGLDLPMHSYVFHVRGRPLYVYYCLWEDHAMNDGPKSTRQNMTSSLRLRSVIEGRRNTGQQVIEVALAGARGPEDAEAATIRMLESAIVP